MLVFGYIRVSSIEQEQGFGQDVQENAVLDYCEAQNLAEPELIYESKSGESLLSRHEIKLVLARAEAARDKGEEVHIVSFKLDRLARDVIDQETMVGRALSKGFRLHSTFSAENDTLNPAYAGDPMRVAIRQFFGIYNQLERATIQLRLDGGLHLKAKEGGSTGGRMPFGYWAVNKEIVIEPSEAQVVQRAFEMHDSGVDLVGSLVVLQHEFPKMCGHWKKSFLWRLLKRRDLYQHGLYRTRLGVQATKQLGLIVYTPRPGVPIVAARVQRVDWASTPDPMHILTLSLLCGASEMWIKRQVNDRKLAARWNKGKLLLDREIAQQIAQLWAVEQAADAGGVKSRA